MLEIFFSRASNCCCAMRSIHSSSASFVCAISDAVHNAASNPTLTSNHCIGSLQLHRCCRFPGTSQPADTDTAAEFAIPCRLPTATPQYSQELSPSQPMALGATSDRNTTCPRLRCNETSPEPCTA